MVDIRVVEEIEEIFKKDPHNVGKQKLIIHINHGSAVVHEVKVYEDDNGEIYYKED